MLNKEVSEIISFMWEQKQSAPSDEGAVSFSWLRERE